MGDWFTVEKIEEDTFAISEYRHWEETHSYLLCGTKRALLIDTGLGVQAVRPVVEGLTELPVDVVTTHVHWDHIGGHHEFERFAVHEAEADWISGRYPRPKAEVLDSLMKEPHDFPEEFQPDSYEIFSGSPARILKDGDSFELGGRNVRVLHTPGHSPGHICLYEEDRQNLFTGDLIYSGKLDMFYPSTDPEAFRSSVRRIAVLPVKRILPGHHTLQIPVCMIARIGEALDRLKGEGKLTQGGGIFPFHGFQVHI